ncbi:glycosyltransferase [Paenibacillus lemnae]|uniref:Glycosyltransferase family 1 protein n=1 Tax=Paenibacillus lemnae TaxID=1330551 RepID=A0A848MDQ8_PAELE|nr:glycosyltransferase [Paenibacillus lemnae]NMO97554.1 glycosyltransferase family 1 protein [Paenibacillus lemnae]
MNIIFASHTYIGGPFVVGSHHLAREMDKLGHHVIHVSTPLSPFHLLKWKDRDIQNRFRIWKGEYSESGPVNSVPFTMLPWEIAGPFYKKTKRNWMLPSLRRLMKQHGMDHVDILLMDQPRFVGLDRMLKPKLSIYRPTDIYSKMTGDSVVAAAEAEIMSRVSALVSTSEPVHSELIRHNPDLPSLILENGVEYEHFAAPAEEPEELSAIPGPRAIYIGAIDDRLDLDALRRLAEAKPELSVVIIGPVQESVTRFFKDLSNVYLLGAKPYSAVPAFLQHCDVALLPLSDHPANAGRSPMKLYEYMAAGLPAVVTETPELARRSEPFIYFFKGAEEIAAKVEEALQKSSRKEEVKQLAARHAWDSKAAQLLTFVENL